MVSSSASTSLKKSWALLVITSSRAFANGLPNAFGRVMPLITTSGAPKLLFDRSTSIKVASPNAGGSPAKSMPVPVTWTSSPPVVIPEYCVALLKAYRWPSNVELVAELADEDRFGCGGCVDDGHYKSPVTE